MASAVAGASVLVTGGAGYIGSHCCKLLSRAGYAPTVFDNLSTGNARAVRWGPLVEGDVRDTNLLARTLDELRPEAVIHFAASAYVGESVANPGKYYANNVGGMISLLEACLLAGVKRIVFSSSCATYGVPEVVPITEATAQCPVNPYGRTKLIGENMLADHAAAHGLSYVILRYFNACGADLEGEIGEWHDPETHLIPRALMAALDRSPALEIYGSDYATPDGTCVRDFVHVTDLARGHLQALSYLLASGKNATINLGSGHGHSILEVIAAIERITGKEVPVNFRPRRAGDPPILVADTSKAKATLGFATEYSSLDAIIRTALPSIASKSAL